MNLADLRGLPCVKYHRVSGNGQLREHGGTGLDRQDENTARFTKMAGFECMKTFEESYSGAAGNASINGNQFVFDIDRPKFQKMVEWCRVNGVVDIVVESLDRFARHSMVQTALLAVLERWELRLWSATTGEECVAAYKGDPMRRAMIQIQGIFAELEKQRLVIKLKHGRAVRAKQLGRASVEGRKPYGFHVDPIKAQREQVVLGTMMSMLGKKTLCQIAKELNQRGYRTRGTRKNPDGKEWTGKRVKAICNAELERRENKTGVPCGG